VGCANKQKKTYSLFIKMGRFRRRGTSGLYKGNARRYGDDDAAAAAGRLFSKRRFSNSPKETMRLSVVRKHCYVFRHETRSGSDDDDDEQQMEQQMHALIPGPDFVECAMNNVTTFPSVEFIVSRGRARKREVFERKRDSISTPVVIENHSYTFPGGLPNAHFLASFLSFLSLQDEEVKKKFGGIKVGGEKIYDNTTFGASSRQRRRPSSSSIRFLPPHRHLQTPIQVDENNILKELHEHLLFSLLEREGGENNEKETRRQNLVDTDDEDEEIVKNVTEEVVGMSEEDYVPLFFRRGDIIQKELPQLPDTFDWREFEEGQWDVPVEQQGECGSCYALAAAYVLQSRFRIALLKKNITYEVSISPENPLACSYYNQACSGGFPFLVGRHARDLGIPSASCEPYRGGESTCEGESTSRSANRVKKTRECVRNGVRFFAKDYGYVGGYYGNCNEKKIMREIMTNGPVVVALDATDEMQGYTQGVYESSYGPRREHETRKNNTWEYTSHAVVVIGWGFSEAEGKFWIIRNSWGRSFGMDGYLYFRRGVNDQGIEAQAIYLVPDVDRLQRDSKNFTL